MSKRLLLLVLVGILLTACGFKGFKQSGVINMNGDTYVITMAIFPIDGVDSIEKRHIPNPDTLDALGIPRSLIDNKGQSHAKLEAIPLGTDIPDVNRDFRGFVEFKDKYFPDTTPRQPGGVGQAVMIVKGKLGVVMARTTSFEILKGETVDIPVVVMSYTANLFEISYPCCGHGTCPEFASIYPSGSVVVGSTVQLQLVGNKIGTCQTILNVTLYVNNPPIEPIIEELEIPITITVTE